MLYVITNRKLAPNVESYFQIIKECFENNVEALVIREKDMQECELENLCERILELRRSVKGKSITKIIMNSNINMAKKYNLEGVQLSYRNFIDEYGEKKSLEFHGGLGVAVHSVEEALDAFKRNADYIIVGHIFETQCKLGLAPRGLGIIKAIRENTNKHIVAIGGIDESNFSSVLNSGANSVAMMSQIMCCTDIKNFLQKICSNK